MKHLFPITVLVFLTVAAVVITLTPAESPLPILGLGIIVFVIALVRRSRHMGEARDDAFRRLARRLDWRFHGEHPPHLPTLLSHLPLGAYESGRITRSVVGQLPIGTVGLLDYVVGEPMPGRKGEHHTQTVLLLRNAACHVPAFSVKPERIRDRMAQRLGAPDLNFDEDPTFSRMFRIDTSTPATVRPIFTAAVRKQFAHQPKVAVEASAGTIGVYRLTLAPLDELDDAGARWERLKQATAVLAIVFGVLLFAGSVRFFISGQSFEEFSDMEAPSR